MLILTEARPEDGEENKPKIKGRIITTIQKAKEVRPLVERVVTIAIRALPQLDAAARLESGGERNSEEWKKGGSGPGWAEWNQAIAPVLAARRRTLQLLGSKQAVQILFDDIVPCFSDRPGGYTRVLRLAKPRLGDAGVRAILEFVGTHDRNVARPRSRLSRASGLSRNGCCGRHASRRRRRPLSNDKAQPRAFRLEVAKLFAVLN